MNVLKKALGSAEVDLVFTHFSDTYVISAQASEDGYAEVVHTAAKLCFELLKLGHLTRGAVVRGQVRHDDGVLYGPAVLEAHEIEQRVATYPRLIVTDDSASLADEHAAAVMQVDWDGLRYLDVLRAGTAGRRAARIEQLADLLRICKDALSRHYSNLNVRAKYEWQMQRIRAEKEFLESRAEASRRGGEES